MCSAYNRKPLRGGAAAAATSSEVWSSSRSIKWDARAQANIWSISGSSCGQLFRREIRANHQLPRKTRSFRSGSSISAGNVAMKAKNHEKMFRNTQARSVERGLNLFFTACGHTGFKCNTLFENFPSTRAARWWASTALT